MPLRVAQPPAPPTPRPQKREAPVFAPRELLDYSKEEREEIADMVAALYESGVLDRRKEAAKHLIYDQMFRGEVEKYSPRTGPWPDSSHTHTQMPYWLVDSIEARLNHTIWSQNPLVIGIWENPNDRARTQKSARLVEWHLQPRRMNARALWSRASKIRLNHGKSVSLIYPAVARYKYRTLIAPEVPEDYQMVNGMPIEDSETGEPIKVPNEPQVQVEESIRYQGPTMYPLEWDDTMYPIGCMNLQAKAQDNPGGADWVVVRQVENLSLMRNRSEVSEDGPGGTFHDPLYGFMFEDERDWKWWEDNAPAVPISLSADWNNEREKQQQTMEGTNAAGGRAKIENRPNPECEVLWHFGPWRLPGQEAGGEEEEMIFFVSRRPRVLLGAFRLSDFVFTGRRPLLEMHYQTVSNRIDSMGVCEIVFHLSEELDTIHNMRMDVGFATNMPWAFVRAAAGINPSDINIHPMALIPVDDPKDVVYPQFQNVTSFYHQEENLTLSIVERVMGVTDLFLGMSPTKGGAARHATGFLGTQQEAEARMANPLSQDAESFSFLCKMIRDLEVQYGPEERAFRVTGRSEDVDRQVITRDDLWYEGEYDLRLGANVGMYSQGARYERAVGEYQQFAQNPIVAQDMSRLWELSAEVLRAGGRRESEIELRLGPKDALPGGDPKDPNEVIQEIINFRYGDGGFPQPHANDDNGRFVRIIMDFIQSDAYMAMGQPNLEGFINYMGAQQQAMMAKQQQQQKMMAEAQAGPQDGRGLGGGRGASPQARAAAQMPPGLAQGAPQAGGNGAMPPPPPPMPGM